MEALSFFLVPKATLPAAISKYQVPDSYKIQQKEMVVLLSLISILFTRRKRISLKEIRLFLAMDMISLLFLLIWNLENNLKKLVLDSLFSLLLNLKQQISMDKRQLLIQKLKYKQRQFQKILHFQVFSQRKLKKEKSGFRISLSWPSLRVLSLQSLVLTLFNKV